MIPILYLFLVLSLLIIYDTLVKILRHRGLNKCVIFSFPDKLQYLFKNHLRILKGLLGWRHEQIFIVFLGITIAYALRVNLSIGVVAMTDNTTDTGYPVLNWTTAEKGSLSGAFFWGYLVMQIPAGTLAGRFGPVKFLGGAMLFCGIATLILPVIAIKFGFYGTYACRVMQGLGQGFIYPCVNTHMSKWAVPLERGKLFSFAFGGSQLGTILMLAIGAALSKTSGGWPSIYYYSGAAAILWAIWMFICGADSPRSHRWISEEEKNYIESNFIGSSANSKKMKPPWKAIATSRPLLALLLVHMGQNWGFWTLLTLIPTYINGVLKFDIQKNGWTSSFPYFTMWVLTFIFAFIADLINKYKLLPLSISRKMWNSIAHYGGAIALLILSYTNGGETGAIALLTVAVGLNAATYTGYLTNHLDLSPNFAGILMGITNGLANLTSILGPSIAGYIVTDDSNNAQWQIVFLTSAAIFFVGNTIFIIFGSTETQPWNAPKQEESIEDPTEVKDSNELKEK